MEKSNIRGHSIKVRVTKFKKDVQGKFNYTEGGEGGECLEPAARGWWLRQLR